MSLRPPHAHVVPPTRVSLPAGELLLCHPRSPAFLLWGRPPIHGRCHTSGSCKCRGPVSAPRTPLRAAVLTLLLQPGREVVHPPPVPWGRPVPPQWNLEPIPHFLARVHRGPNQGQAQESGCDTQRRPSNKYSAGAHEASPPLSAGPASSSAAQAPGRSSQGQGSFISLRRGCAAEIRLLPGLGAQPQAQCAARKATPVVTNGWPRRSGPWVRPQASPPQGGALSLDFAKNARQA
ncbi:hypothetical protein NDU88_010044 [Pleurodeles waltl]|uniref:Uncharacterized protein n=1 Tax=Pleurodeles waltl TaxID=8319 RepID=A0AAV7S0R1_PLEWA|nr:hypothetical protein NDU88_010044 [Pleurodeles waltl]